MNRLNNASIKNKLKFLISMSLLLMLLIAGSILMINTVLSNKQVLQHELNALTEVTSLTITPALIFDNSADAQQTLTSLKAHKNVIYAAVTKTGQLHPFANFSRHIDKTIPNSFITNCGPIKFNFEFMQVCKPLTFDQTEYGHIILIISLHDIYHRLLKELGIALLGLALAALVIFWFLENIAKKLSDPILELVRISEDVKHSGNYQQCATITSNDEIGQLGLAFNDMLEQINNRNLALNQQKDTLEDQVQARTQDLQHKTDEAYQLAKKAQAASKAKSEFLATMSHEIRTPMNGVLGMTELLLKTALNNHQKKLADKAYRSAESLLGIINNILDFSKIESGKLQLSHDDFDLRHLLEDVTEIIASQAHVKGLELTLNLSLELDGTVRGDADRLRQVFVNLLGNAIKFTQQGEIQLKVSLIDSNNSDTQINLLCEVKDTGPGIAPEQQSVIFESFTQADGSTTRHHGGTGLGLTISRQLLELMGSSLKLKSTLGKGSCFSFTLCLNRSNQSIPQKIDLSSLHDINVLIVDDNTSNREILSSQLNHWGINCHSASSAQAINYLRDAYQHNITYQIALLDWHMPKTDGLTLAKTLYEDPLFQSLSLVMLCSDCSSIDHDKSRKYGIKHFLSKPFIQKNLLACLLDLTGSSDYSPASRSDTSTPSPLSGNILLAEDNLVNQEVGVAILRSIGCETDIVNNGAEAVTAATNKQYDIILMDCHMPIMDGFAATKKIREVEKFNKKEQCVPIIALTADVKKGIVEQCKKAGMDEYISKPFSQKQLQTILEKYLTTSPKKSITTWVEQTEENSTPTTEIINQAALENLKQHITKNGESLLTKAINIFLDSAPEQLKALQKALEQQEFSKIEFIAHNLKSSCANLGVMSLTKYAAIIENSAEQKNIQGIAPLLTKIQNDLPIAIFTLNNELKKISVAQGANQTTHQIKPN